jgi:hypothetical protein
MKDRSSSTAYLKKERLIINDRMVPLCPDILLAIFGR